VRVLDSVFANVVRSLLE